VHVAVCSRRKWRLTGTKELHLWLNLTSRSLQETSWLRDGSILIVAVTFQSAVRTVSWLNYAAVCFAVNCNAGCTIRQWMTYVNATAFQQCAACLHSESWRQHTWSKRYSEKCRIFFFVYRFISSGIKLVSWWLKLEFLVLMLALKFKALDYVLALRTVSWLTSITICHKIFLFPSGQSLSNCIYNVLKKLWQGFQHAVCGPLGSGVGSEEGPKRAVVRQKKN